MIPTRGPVRMAKWEQKSTNIHVCKCPGVEMFVRRKSTHKYQFEVRIFGHAIAWAESQSLDQAREAAQDQLEMWLMQRMTEMRGVHVLDLFDAIKEDEGAEN